MLLDIIGHDSPRLPVISLSCNELITKISGEIKCWSVVELEEMGVFVNQESWNKFIKANNNDPNFKIIPGIVLGHAISKGINIKKSN